LIYGEELVQQFFYAMSSATAPSVAAAWLEGFLKGSGTILLIDQDLWSVVNTWVESLTEEVFIDVLPLLRRTFAAFSKPERRRLGEKVKTGSSGSITAKAMNNIDEERGKKGIPVIMQMLGYATNTN
jgi:Family of unknown function (DUF5682)